MLFILFRSFGQLRKARIITKRVILSIDFWIICDCSQMIRNFSTAINDYLASLAERYIPFRLFKSIQSVLPYWPCHTRQFSLQLATQWRCIASCKEDFLVWHPMFATSLATKNCVASCRESRSSFYFSQCHATSGCDTPTATCLTIFWEGTNHNTT